MAKKKVNDNCLQGIRCPLCGSFEPFRIVAMAEFTIHDSGTDEFIDVEWCDTSSITCAACGHVGVVREFTVRRKRERVRVLKK